MTQVFISYSRKDLAFVERLAEDLKAAGLEVWYDLSGLDGGTRWGREIQSAIQRCQVFVVVLSPNSVESEWVEKEFMYANSLKRKIIPLLLQPCETPMWFINLHFIDVQGTNYDSHFWIILKALGVKPGDEVAKSSVNQGTGTEEKVTERRSLPLPRKIKVRPTWIIALAGFLTVLAFAVWGMPLLAARLAPTSAPTPTATATYTPTFTPTATASRTPTSTSTPIFGLTPTLGIGSTLKRTSDGMIMVYVPEGQFSMGGNSSSDEQPIHTVNLDAYWIDKTEVTNAMYVQCLHAGACQAPTSSTYSPSYADLQFADYPVSGLNWNDAVAYCKWAGVRLPSEAEWEKAARGTDGRIYPWGNSLPSCLLANIRNDGGPIYCMNGPSAVGSYLSGASPYGALDMAGNVMEWVNDWYLGTYYSQSPESNPTGPISGQYRAQRGGSRRTFDKYLRTSARSWALPSSSGDYFGFRCDRSAVSP